MLEHGFRKYEIIKLLNDIKKRIKRVEENVPIQIDDAINQLLNGAPQALDTLKELADALGNDGNFATSIANQITELNNKIDSINVKKDWNQNDENADDYIENRTHYKENSEIQFYTDVNLTNKISVNNAIELFNSYVDCRNISEHNTLNANKDKLYSKVVYYSESYPQENGQIKTIIFYKVKNNNKYGIGIENKTNNESVQRDVILLENDGVFTINDFEEKHGLYTQYSFVKSEEVYHKLDINYIPNNINDSIILKESSIPSEGFESNKFYELGEISQNTTFVLKTPTNNNILNKYIIQFSIGTTIPTITWPSDIKWENGNVPTISADKTYLLEIINNLAQIKEF